MTYIVIVFKRIKQFTLNDDWQNERIERIC
jgi:hypothetical protein